MATNAHDTAARQTLADDAEMHTIAPEASHHHAADHGHHDHDHDHDHAFEWPDAARIGLVAIAAVAVWFRIWDSPII